MDGLDWLLGSANDVSQSIDNYFDRRDLEQDMNMNRQLSYQSATGGMNDYMSWRAREDRLTGGGI